MGAAVVLVSSGPRTNLPGAMPFVPGGMVPCHFTCLLEAAAAISEARERRSNSRGGAGAVEQRGLCSMPGSREGRPRCRLLAGRWHSSPALPVPRCTGSAGEDGHLGRWAGVSLHLTIGERTVFKST